MVEYIEEFQRLVQMFLEIVPTIRARPQHFVRGLDPVTRRQVNLVLPKNFIEVLEMAQQVEICE